ncbi:hypothetical protein RND71_000884 [Anisodus tanguticus]|uniref:FRIGIDA-like protein n=1 Tax=Anisodus tanguticus TaxID=243964 RepID=A0AAE1T198_9SOLA|nr:hypothetical protein RND71_000884 [Anisodus tanguticus]
MLVLEALDGFYPPDHQKEEIGFHRNIIRQSCILLLEQLMELSPGIKPEAKLEASKLAFAWKVKMMAEMENHLAILGFLLLLGCYRLASAFDKDELESLYDKVARHVNTSEICHVLGSDDFSSVERSKRNQAQGCTYESICNMDMKGEGHDVICNCASSLHRTSDPALLVLDAFRSSEKFLQKLNFMLKRRLLCLHLTDRLLGLLEKVQPTERVVTLVKILGLTDKIQCFVENLRNNKQWLLAFNYVYEFGLVDLVSSVSLLKDYVWHSEQIAKQILHAGNSSYRAQRNTINYEICALRDTVTLIVDRGLQSEYSPSYLQRQIKRLKYQMSNLRESNSNRDFIAKFQQVKPNTGICEFAPIAQMPRWRH